jgi:flagella basal body P-ring formation protein FlgA
MSRFPPPAARSLRLLAQVGAFACGAAIGSAAWAQASGAVAGVATQSEAPALPAAANIAALRDFVDQQVDLQNARVEVEVGHLDPRLQLKPCDRIEPFVPTGARLYGRSHIGLRCKERGSWTVYLPITVHVYARVPVAARNLANGETLKAADVAFEERDISAPGMGPFPTAEQIEGRILVRGYLAGQPIVSTAFRPNPVVANGDPVKVIVRGSGFSIVTTGVALSQANEGQPLRVKLESGKTVQGVARPGKQVEVAI